MSPKTCSFDTWTFMTFILIFCNIVEQQILFWYPRMYLVDGGAESVAGGGVVRGGRGGGGAGGVSGGSKRSGGFGVDCKCLRKLFSATEENGLTFIAELA